MATMDDQLLSRVAGVLAAQGVRSRRVAVGLSGGLDSVVLLDLLNHLRRDFDLAISAIHVNHGISQNAADWERFCSGVCAALGIPLRVERVKVSNQGEGVEAAARRLRYQAFASVDADFVALAHHLDDQAETLLLQLLRGAGVKGMAAMPELRRAPPNPGHPDTGGPAILRPLLEVSRNEIADYASARELDWVEDDSNADADLDRNYLRTQVLPLLAARFPGYRETFSRAARNMADQSQLAEDLAAIDLALPDAFRVPVETLRRLSTPRALNLLRRMFALQGLPMPPRERLEEALRQCRDAAADAQVHVGFESHGLRCHRGMVALVAESQAFPGDWQTDWDGLHELQLPGGLGHLRGRRASGEGIACRHFEIHAAIVRGRSGGERIRPAPNRPVRELKKMFQELTVPPWERSRMPLVFFGDRLAWVPGIGVAEEFRAGPGEQGIVPEWERG